MKAIQHTLLVLFVLLLAAGCGEQGDKTADQTATDESTAATTTAAGEDDDVFYALGVAVSRNLQQFDLSESELAQVQQGIRDGALGNELRVEVEQFGPRLQQMAMERAQRAAAGERQEGEAFLAEVAAAEGAERTASGMVFRSLNEGSGPSPEATDTVRVHYRGTLRNGTVFDSSYDRGEPVQFSLNQVIPCWSEGLQLMKVGGKAKLVCPPEIAYGDRANGPIPAGSTLIFEVELLEIVE